MCIAYTEVFEMLETIFYILCTLLALVGLSDITKTIVVKLFAIDKNDNFVVIVPVKGHNEQIEHILRNTYCKLKWNNLLYKKDIICLDLGIDKETKQICKNMSNQYPALKLVKIENLDTIF